MFLALTCSVLMLLPKPLILYSRSKSKRRLLSKDESDFDPQHKLIGSEEDAYQDEPCSNHKENDFSELFVHQLIETIEFVLGSLSNTASYLRLWALSLAHGQLSRVFYDLIFGWTIKKSNGVFSSFLIIVIGFVFYFFTTLGVIVIMDSMECFLHALRLHWVEFQNKFYKGEGIKFEAFHHSFPELN